MTPKAHTLEEMEASNNGGNMMRQTYQFLRWHFPALFEDNCPYDRDTRLYIYGGMGEQALIAFSTFCLLGHELQAPERDKGHISIFVSPTRKHVDELIDYVVVNTPLDELGQLIAEVEEKREQWDTDVEEHLNKQFKQLKKG